MLTFKGSLVSPTSVNKSYNITITTNRDASFVEMNPFDKNDSETLRKVKSIYGNWGPNASLINDIFQYEGQSCNNVNSRYFVLTEQNEELEKVKPSAVLGLAKTTQMADNGVFIDMIQVNPWHVFSRRWDVKRNVQHDHYSHCGTSIIESLKKIFSGKDLWLHSPRHLIDYFLAKGFEIVKLPTNKEEALMRLRQAMPSGVVK